jgi:N-acyl-D-amino-acid deacylase
MGLWVRHGTVVDGSGAPARPADLLVEDDIITDVGPGIAPEGPAGFTEIDATGLTVAPGFIDLHSHSDIALIADPLVTCKLAQGITLELLGQDGMSVAPLTDATAELWRRHLAGLTGSYPVDWSWRSYDEYLRLLTPTAANVATLVGHGTLRLNVLGMEQRPVSDAELDRMVGLLSEALDAGAFGLSGGLVYTPGAYGDLRELVALNRVVAAAGKLWVVHMRFEGDRILDGMDEMFKLVEQTGVALHISHFKALGRKNWGRAPEIIERVEVMRGRGMDITVDQYPYTAGSTMLSAILPPWAHAEGPARLRAYLGDPAALRRLEAEVEAGLPDWEGFVPGAGWDKIVLSDVGGGSPELTGRSVAELAEEWRCRPFQAAVRLLLEADFAVSMVIHAMSEDDVSAFMRQPWRTGGTDALLGGKPHPRAYGSYPRILGHYVRERGLLTLEEAVRQMTGAAADRLRLTDRGRIAPGMKADLCLFDAACVIDRATFARPTEPPAGIAWVIVNGRPVLRDAVPTGERPGALLRQR